MWVNVNTSAHSWSFIFLPSVYFIGEFERVFFPNQREIPDARWRVIAYIVTLSCSRTIIKHCEGPGVQGKEGTVIIEQCWKKKQANSTVLLEVLLLLPYGRQRGGSSLSNPAQYILILSQVAQAANIQYLLTVWPALILRPSSHTIQWICPIQ